MCTSHRFKIRPRILHSSDIASGHRMLLLQVHWRWLRKLFENLSSIILQTRYGDIEFGFFPKVAPLTVAHITKLARLGCYNTNHFFRVSCLVSAFAFTPSDFTHAGSVRTLLLPIHESDTWKTQLGATYFCRESVVGP